MFEFCRKLLIIDNQLTLHCNHFHSFISFNELKSSGLKLKFKIYFGQHNYFHCF